MPLRLFLQCIRTQVFLTDTRTICHGRHETGSYCRTRKYMNRLQRLLHKRKFEDPEVITAIETIFKKKRGYVFRMPPKNSDIILLVSGGLDSILTWGLLMEEYHLRVHPLFLNKGERRFSQEERSLDYFNGYYAERYPSLFIAPIKQTIYLPQKEILSALKTPFDNLLRYDKKTTKGFNPYTTTNIFLGSPGVVPMYAMLHARYLELSANKKIRTIFSSIMFGDGIMCPSQTITSVRTINLAMCTFTGEYSWQFTSPSVEPCLHLYYQKRDLIKWGSRHHILMEKTWSCYRGLSQQCGRCLACDARKIEFKKANIPDPTQYSWAYDLSIRLKNKAGRIMRRLRTR